MLSEKIGNNAGLIWSALEEGDLNLALGWLAREGKVKFNEVEGELFISL